MLDVFSAKFLLLHNIPAAVIIVSAPAGVSDNLHYFAIFLKKKRNPEDSFTVFIALMDIIRMQITGPQRSRTRDTSRFNFR